MKEALKSSETSVLIHGVRSQKTPFFKFKDVGLHESVNSVWDYRSCINTLLFCSYSVIIRSIRCCLFRFSFKRCENQISW
jgi:hypothetical protein